MGSVTRVAYAPSTRFYLEDERHPEGRWKTPLPFPVQGVARVEVIDQISKGKLTTEYRYHHGYWDGAEREFRGYGRVEQRDTEVFENFNADGLHADRPFEQMEARVFSPPLETRTWFHQGPIGDEFGEWEEADYRDEYWSDDPQVLTRPQSMVDVLKALPRRDRLSPLAGYIYQPAGAGSAYATGYFVATAQQRYDCQSTPDGQGRGLLIATRDPLGRETTISHDSYSLLPTRVTDPAGLTTQASYDYHVLQPREVTDLNGNRSAFAFTPLGLLERSAVMGKVGENVGDTLDMPGSRLVYDFLAFAECGQPISVRTIRRVRHLNDADMPLPERDETIESIEYSDGFGRLLQTRTQAEHVTFGDPIFGDAGLPADQSLPVGEAVGYQRAAADPLRVVVSGWQIYDNKGRVVEKYEPFFSMGFNYQSPTDAEFGPVHPNPLGSLHVRCQ